jgi:hypothetical protein
MRHTHPVVGWLMQSSAAATRQGPVRLHEQHGRGGACHARLCPAVYAHARVHAPAGDEAGDVLTAFPSASLLYYPGEGLQVSGRAGLLRLGDCTSAGLRAGSCRAQGETPSSACTRRTSPGWLLLAARRPVVYLPAGVPAAGAHAARGVRLPMGPRPLHAAWLALPLPGPWVECACAFATSRATAPAARHLLAGRPGAHGAGGTACHRPRRAGSGTAAALAGGGCGAPGWPAQRSARRSAQGRGLHVLPGKPATRAQAAHPAPAAPPSPLA